MLNLKENKTYAIQNSWQSEPNHYLIISKTVHNKYNHSYFVIRPIENGSNCNHAICLWDKKKANRNINHMSFIDVECIIKCKSLNKDEDLKLRKSLKNNENRYRCTRSNK